MKGIYNYSKCHLSTYFLLFVSASSILLSLGVFSCSSSVQNPLLLRADSLMEKHPDSALTIIESISSPQKLSRSDRAYYALLLTQARHKNYVPLTNDSLIKTAVEYYGDKNKSFRVAEAHYYLGATYRDLGHVSFAVEEYMKAIQLMPEENDFLAMIYNNLAECYEENDLYEVAMKTYRRSCQILRTERKKIFPLRGIAYLFLLQNKLDSALCYYQKAFDCAVAVQDSNWMGAISHDFAMVYEQKQDFIQVDKYVSKAIKWMDPAKSACAYRLKGRIMLSSNKLDSARYYFNCNLDGLDIYEKANHYDGLYQVEKKMGNWKAAVDNVDTYMILYDSIQELSDTRELDQLMDNYQLENHKKELFQRTRMIISILAFIFLLLVSICVFIFLWNDRRMKKRYITLYQDLMQNRVDVMLLKGVELAHLEKESLNDRLKELREQQLQICLSMFQTTECYKKLQVMERLTPKQLLSQTFIKSEMNITIRKAFVDVMGNLKECCPTLTDDDLFYCILCLLHCSKNIIIELMGVSSDALKMRKSRIKRKMDSELFESVFKSDYQ